MKRIRSVEQEIASRYSEQQMRCPTHLSIGQEGVAAGVGLCLANHDYAVSGHRAHAHYISKGGSIKAMIAEIYGKKTGCARGKGGSMHLIDTSVGFMGSTAIVGGTIPVGVGLGLALKLNRSNNISVVYLGDGAVEEGVFYEAVNFSVLREIPVLFICENNQFSVYTPISYRQPDGRKIFEMVRGMGMDASCHDGNNVELVYEVTKSAVEKIRSGHGPIFLEFETWRWLEHCGPNLDNDLGYRSLEDNEMWLDRDPISCYEKSLLENKVLTMDDIATIQNEIDIEVREAFEFAIKSEFPSVNEAGEGIYA